MRKYISILRLRLHFLTSRLSFIVLYFISKLYRPLNSIQPRGLRLAFYGLYTEVLQYSSLYIEIKGGELRPRYSKGRPQINRMAFSNTNLHVFEIL